MTMIACTLNYGIPFLVSDLLVSQKEKGAVIIPTLPENADFPDIEHRSYYLAQKSYVLTPYVCLTMAGNVSEMTDFLREFRLRCSYYDNLTDQHITDFIQDYDVEKNMAESSFLIFMLGNTLKNTNPPKITMCHFMHGNWSSYANKLFEGTFACGTGKQQFFEYMDDIKGAGDEHFITHRHREVASINIILAAKMLASERATRKTIMNQWGAGFEMIYMYGGEFVKLDNISYLLMKARIIQGGFEFYPEKLLHYEYYNNVMFIYGNYTKETWEQETRLRGGFQLLYRGAVGGVNRVAHLNTTEWRASLLTPP